jgi:tetrahydromethanopterin S-methyltransferase subunit H
VPVDVGVPEGLGVGVGVPVRLGVGVGVGVPVGDGVDAAGQVWDRLNHATWVLPVSVFTVADALSSTAPGAEPANACLSVGGPKVVIV